MDVVGKTTEENSQTTRPPEQREREVDLVMIITGFFMGSALELSFNSPSVQAPISSATLYCLALLILVGFACIFAGSIVASQSPTFGKVLKRAGVFIGVTAFVFAIAMPFPTILRFGIWAIYIFYLLLILISYACCY